MEQQVLQTSLRNLNVLVTKKISGIPNISSCKEIKDLTRFLRESQNLRTELASLCPSSTTNEEFSQNYNEADELAVMDIIHQACNIIISLYQVVDHNKIEETQSEWIKDDAQSFLAEMRQAFGTRIPVLPGGKEPEDEQ